MGKSNKKAPSNAKASVSASVQRTIHGVHYSGPVPPPGIMEQMEKILPGAADRIFTMAEKDQAAQYEHIKRIDENNQRIIEDEHSENITALYMAFIVAIAVCICGTILVLKGHSTVGTTMLGTTLLGIVVSFLRRGKEDTKRDK